MFTFRFVDIPANHNEPYEHKCDTIASGLRFKKDGGGKRLLISVVDTYGSVHRGIITKEGELCRRYVGDYDVIYLNRGLKLHQSTAFKEAVDATPVQAILAP